MYYYYAHLKSLNCFKFNGIVRQGAPLHLVKLIEADSTVRSRWELRINLLKANNRIKAEHGQISGAPWIKLLAEDGHRNVGFDKGAPTSARPRGSRTAGPSVARSSDERGIGGLSPTVVYGYFGEIFFYLG
jgi:hypothetical protein